MKRALWVGASVSALVVAAMVPWSASHARDVSIGISTPEFGIRIGAPHYGGYYPPPVYVPPPVVYVPPRYVVPPPRVIYSAPYYYPRYGHYYRHPHYWRHHHHHNRGHHGHGHDRRWR